MRTRISNVRGRIKRVHLIVAGAVIVVLVAGGVAWAVVDGGPGSNGAQPLADGTAGPGAPNAGAAPVPTFAPPGSGRGDGKSANNRQPAGMPTELSAKRDGNKVVLQWKDNTTNEDGFIISVTQGRTTFQVGVPAGTTRYDGVTAGKDVRTCFSVAPFSWTAPIAAPSARKCTDSGKA